jgi:hypothetical protein
VFLSSREEEEEGSGVIYAFMPKRVAVGAMCDFDELIHEISHISERFNSSKPPFRCKVLIQF